MKTYLKTRGTGRSSDYAFLGATPPDLWWSGLGERIYLEEPEVIVSGWGGPVSVLISGIPSARQDRIGTAVRYTIVVDGGSDAAALLNGVVAAGLDPAGRRRLGERLDKEIDAEMVDAVYASRSDGAELPGIVAAVLRDLALDDGTAGDAHEPTREGSWVGSLDRAEHRAAFLGHTRWLIGGGRGLAFTSHTLSSVAGVRQHCQDLGPHVAVLVADGDITELTTLGKALVPPVTQAPPADRRRAGLIAVGVVVLAAAGLVWWIVRQLT